MFSLQRNYFFNNKVSKKNRKNFFKVSLKKFNFSKSYYRKKNFFFQEKLFLKTVFLF